MFLKNLINRNPQFIKTVVHLHQDGKIPANSYVLDLDTIEKNTSLIAAEGQKLGLKVYPMTKQIGRNVKAMQVISRQGLDAYVAVDMSCARPINTAGYKIGHLGHLVQIPIAETDMAARFEPFYWTVFNLEKARATSDSCRDINRKQALLARVFALGDTFYMGHEGGFQVDDILWVADEFDKLSNAYFAGITSFPTLLFDVKKNDVYLTPNMTTLEKAANALRAAGRKDIEINAPGTTSTIVMKMLADAGATQVEPGHGLTGTTPLHAVRDLPESPGLLYLSEISHIYSGKPFCFGGGLYIDPVFPDYHVKALVGSDTNTLLNHLTSVKIPPPNAIDYYGILSPEVDQKVRVGDSVVFGFRVQAFITRAFIVPITGISSDKPVVEGVYTSDGRKTNWPRW